MNPGSVPWQLNGRKDHKKARDPNTHVNASLPRGGSAVGFPGGGGGGGLTSKREVGLSLGFFLGSQTPHKPIYPVVKVSEHVYKHKHTPEPQEKESFNASHGRGKSLTQIVSVEVTRWENGGHSLFKVGFIYGDFLLVIIVGLILFFYHFLVGVALFNLVCMPMRVFVIGRTPVVHLAIPLLGVAEFTR